MALQEALNANNVQRFSDVAHALRGSAASSGAVRVQTLAREAETLGRQAELAAARPLIAQLRNAVQEAQNKFAEAGYFKERKPRDFATELS